MAFDLDAYLTRLRWTGEVRPDLDTLGRLLIHHLRAIPFENFDVLLGRPVRLDLESLQRKLVHDRRGGYCFEHATLFAAALSAIGFRYTRHLARVVLTVPKPESARTHMFILADLPEGRFVVDPGFGGPASPTPLELVDSGIDQPAHRPSHWMTRDSDGWVLRGQQGERDIDLWVSDVSTAYPIDFELSNHYVATHPDSIFRSAMMLSRFTETGRATAINRDATIRHAGDATSWQLEDRQALRRFAAEHLGVDLPELETLVVPAIPGWT
jgi:N-hydroxyarylamine O-acetyltransferase